MISKEETSKLIEKTSSYSPALIMHALRFLKNATNTFIVLAVTYCSMDFTNASRASE